VSLLRNSSKRERLLVIVLSILIIVYPYYNLFLKPISQKILIVNQSISEKQQQYDSIEKLKLTNVVNEKKLENIKIKYALAIVSLPDNSRSPEITYRLNRFVTQNSINLISVTFGQNVKYSKGKLMVLPVTVIINGDYLSTLNFISNIEGDSRIAEIVDINMSSSQGVNASIQSTIILNYYYTQEVTSNNPTYDFKTDNVGKTDLFN